MEEEGEASRENVLSQLSYCFLDSFGSLLLILHSYPYLAKDHYRSANSEELLQAGKIPEKLQPVISLIIIILR